MHILFERIKCSAHMETRPQLQLEKLKLLEHFGVLCVDKWIVRITLYLMEAKYEVCDWIQMAKYRCIQIT